VLAVQEREPPRLVLLDDVDLDAPDEGQALAADVAQDFLVERIAARLCRRLEDELPEVGVRLEHDLVRTRPFLEEVGPRAHRVRADVLAVVLDHLAREGAEVGLREVEHERVIRALQPDPQRVAIDELEARIGDVVVEGLAGLERPLVRFIEPDDPVLDQVKVRRLHLRVEEPQDGEGVVGGDQLPPLALEAASGVK
jgi:hypothetical protein